MLVRSEFDSSHCLVAFFCLDCKLPTVALEFGETKWFVWTALMCFRELYCVVTDRSTWIVIELAVMIFQSLTFECADTPCLNRYEPPEPA